MSREDNLGGQAQHNIVVPSLLPEEPVFTITTYEPDIFKRLGTHFQVEQDAYHRSLFSPWYIRRLGDPTLLPALLPVLQPAVVTITSSEH